MHDGLGAGEGWTRRLGLRNRGSEDGPWMASTWARQHASVRARMVMETVLIEVKTDSRPSYDGV